MSSQELRRGFGLFSSTNPRVGCQGDDYTVVEKGAPHVVQGPGT